MRFWSKPLAVAARGGEGLRSDAGAGCDVCEGLEGAAAGVGGVGLDVAGGDFGRRRAEGFVLSRLDFGGDGGCFGSQYEGEGEDELWFNKYIFHIFFGDIISSPL